MRDIPDGKVAGGRWRCALDRGDELSLVVTENDLTGGAWNTFSDFLNIHMEKMRLTRWAAWRRSLI